MRHGTPRRPRTLLVIALASIAPAAIGCGSSDKSATSTTSTTPTVAAAPTPVETTPPPPPPVETPTVTAPTTTSSRPSSRGSVVAGSSNGKHYRCIGTGLLHDLKAMSRRINRGRASLKRIRKELRRLKKRYPSNVAPPKVAQRYNYLVRKHNALLQLGNRRVRAYNARLNRDCLHT